MQEEDWESVKLEAKKPETRINLREDSFGWAPGHFAANAGVPHVLKVLLDAKAKIDATDNEGNTMLMLACRKAHVKVAEFLLSKKADVEVQNRNGWTALTWDALNGYDELANLLLNASADHTKADNEGVTACMWAARHGHLEIVEMFLACGLNLSVCDNAGLTVLDHCHEHVQMATTITAVNEVNECLHDAAQRNDVEGVREAIEAGADVDLRDGDGWTTLMWAALHNSLDMVQLVVRYGAKPSLLDDNGHLIEQLQTQHLAVGEAVENILTANERLLSAAKENNWQQVAEELTSGAFINVRDDCQRTSLMWAAKHCSAEGVHMLLSKNAHVNDNDSFGWSAVHYAVIEKSAETVSMFHYLGADMKVKTYEGDSLLHMAVRADDAVMIQLLLAAGLDTEDVDVNLLTPLMMAANHGLTNAAQTLIAYGASLEAKSTEALGSRGAMALAVVQGHEAAVAAMLQPVRVPPKLPSEVDGEDNSKPAKPKAKSSVSTSAGIAQKVTATAKKTPAAAGKQQVSAKAKAAAGGVAARRKAAPKAKVEFRGDSPTALLDEAIRLRGEQPWKAVAAPAKVVLKQVDGSGNTALGLAVHFNMTAIATTVLQAKADPNASDDRGITVLMQAVLARQREVVEIMLDLGAKTDKQNKDGQTAIDLCEDDVILHMLHRKMALSKVPASDPTLVEAAQYREKAAAQAKMLTGFCVRFEGLPVELGAEELEQQIRALMRRCGAPNPKTIRVELDPITAQPRGHAYAEFLDAVAQDLSARGDGQEVEGYAVRIFKEPRRPA